LLQRLAARGGGGGGASWILLDLPTEPKLCNVLTPLKHEPYVVLRWCPAGQSAPERVLAMTNASAQEQD
jgi:hypothetical protein